MTRSLLLLLVVAMAMGGCDASIDNPPGIPPDGTASATLDGRRYDFRIVAQPSAYEPGEVVLRAYADGLPRILMLTFEPEVGRAAVNAEMTGYWDLGLCTPSNAYVVAELDDVDIRVTQNESGRIQGTFALRVVSREAPRDVVSITDGVFSVRLTDGSFEYCIEG